jgi:hypothetical protein
MKIRVVAVALSLLVASAAFAQATDPLHVLSGTTVHPGVDVPWVQSGSGAWSFFHAFDAHVTYSSQTGPEEQENEVFSTNWFAAGVRAPIGDRAFVLARGRVSLEPYTLPDDGYPQLLQYRSEQTGEVVLDRMRPQDLFGEAAVQFGFRPSESTLLSLYGGIVGQPALGPAPAQLRPSGVDFAEAPFAYDIQEASHTQTNVITAGFATRLISIEASTFHDSITTGDHTEIDSGGLDSQSMRLTLTPTPTLAIQVSRGELGEDDAKRTINSASLTWGRPSAAITALWTQRQYDADRVDEGAYGIEVALRPGRNTFMVRVEHVDRPAGFPRELSTDAVEEATHYTAGYIFDFTPAARYRTGVGVNVDYRTKTHDLEDIYGHKPQSIYAFVRVRSRM